MRAFSVRTAVTLLLVGGTAVATTGLHAQTVCTTTTTRISSTVYYSDGTTLTVTVEESLKICRPLEQ